MIWYRKGIWATPCMCGHHDHGYSGHCEHMCCTEDADCNCGGFEPQPGMFLPTVSVDGNHPFWTLVWSWTTLTLYPYTVRLAW